ncbi:unnamed protein product [Caenorhabditis auriculariae]|uniref:Ubiquitin carboxyl-terminal hydrolase n=1 Tax=Caenorhabditis auriculariae TaxID=2777116 RepID=A0A8S1HVD5_9PELO|nr:unnamed protein product [Caenorhabditis auriculariae]
MGNCEHLSSAIGITPSQIASLSIRRKFAQEEFDDLPPNPNHGTQEMNAFCTVCGMCPNSWLCLQCGDTFCSRTHKSHGLEHHNETLHSVVVECHRHLFHCYMCDEIIDVDNQDEQLIAIVEALKKLFNTNTDYDDIHYMDEDGEEEGRDLETEEENDGLARSRANTKFLQDEDTGSVPEDDSVMRGSHKRQTKDFFSADLLSGPLCPTNVRQRRRKDRKGRKQKTEYAKVIREAPPNNVPKRRGLKNIGNTCFMNSVIQALNTTTTFRGYLTQLPILEPDDIANERPPVEAPRYITRKAISNLKDPSKNKPPASTMVLAEEMRKVLIQLNQRGKDTAFAPHEFHHVVTSIKPSFRGFGQHDAHEFLRVILERMHQELRRCRIPEMTEQWLTDECGPAPVMPSGSVVSRIFEGALQSQVICLSCKTPSIKMDPFLDISLDLNIRGTGNNTRLVDCMRSFFAKETLDQHEQYMCGHCGTKQPSTKQLFVKVLPNLLCVHLKRFRANGMKNDPAVDFPISGLDIKDFMAPASDKRESTVFGLSAIIVHSGASTSSGHYVAYCYHEGFWFYFSDHTVRLVAESIVQTQKPYLLFYTRRNDPTTVHSSSGSSPNTSGYSGSPSHHSGDSTLFYAQN